MTHLLRMQGRSTAAPATMPAPIGIFDSGIGGVSVLRALRARLPAERFIYVADSGHAPYGDLPAQAIEERAAEVARFLLQRRARALVIACNTASVLAAAGLRRRHGLPIVAMEPAIKPAVQATRSRVVLVLATTMTVRSASVARLCREHGAGVRIILQACPGLADAAERAEFDSAATRVLLCRYLRPGLAEGADTIVLGCTHYAFLIDAIAAIAGPAVHIVEPSAAIAMQLARVLPPVADVPRAVAVPAGAAATSFYTSGSAERLSTFLRAVGEPAAEVSALPAA